MDYIYYIIVFIILLYILCYYIHPSNIIILQSSIDNFNFDLLLQRYPLLIHDFIYNIEDILIFWFNNNIIKKKTKLCEEKEWYLNPYKFLLFHSFEEKELLFSNPYTKLQYSGPAASKDVNIPDYRYIPTTDSNIISIKIKKNQILIIPFKWYIYNENIINKCNIYGIHDYITFLELF
jgi:hypothetical protein